jgi:hypothetical protein
VRAPRSPTLPHLFAFVSKLSMAEQLSDQAKYIPKQKGPPAPDSPSMRAFVSTFPPLGRVTIVDQPTGANPDPNRCGSTGAFSAMLEVDESRAEDPWQLSVWYSNGGEWREVPMERIPPTARNPTTLQVFKPGSKLYKLYFRTVLPTHSPLSFTVKFRNGGDNTWKWVKDHQGAEDGLIILKSMTSQNSISSSLGDYVEDLNPALECRNHQSQSPGTTIWSVEVPIEATKGRDPAVKDVKFGIPWGHQKFLR